MGHLMRQLMGINGEKFLFLEHELFRNWTNEWKTKTGKTPCAWCKRLWRAFDAVPAGNSRASSGFSACHIIPLSGCIHRKAINRNKPFNGSAMNSPPTPPYYGSVAAALHLMNSPPTPPYCGSVAAALHLMSSQIRCGSCREKVYFCLLLSAKHAFV